jgi:two-component system chemotaxis response regulator CheB
MGKIKVLIVDDSILYREVIAQGIELDEAIEVVAKATDPFDARDKILKYNPNVMICDVEMPKMNGIEFIRRLLPQYPLPVIIVSSVSNAVFEALNAGAVDFVSKPNIKVASSLENFIEELIYKIKIATQAKIPQSKGEKNIRPMTIRKIKSHKIIAIGASTGGTEALYEILKGLPPQIPGIVVVQHIPPVFSKMFAERLDSRLPFKVKEATTGDFVESNQVLIAPGDHHMRIKKVEKSFKVECVKGEKMNGHCPSIDILFESVALQAEKDAVGIILTGMGYDGAKGLLKMRRKGAITIGQDEKTSVVYGMPQVAFNIGAVEQQVALDKLSIILTDILY